MLDKYNEIILVDLETTGLYSSKDDVIEFGALQLVKQEDKFKPYAEFNFLVKPNQPISEKITEITGITNEMVKDARSQLDLKEVLIKLFSQNQATTLIVAYNSQFDFSFIEAKMGIPLTHDMLDVMAIFKDRHPYPHKLKDAIIKYGVTLGNTHRAIDDIRATFEVLKEMIKEKANIDSYINRFGYNPKYGVSGKRFPQVKYIAQGFYGSLEIARA